MGLERVVLGSTGTLGIHQGWVGKSRGGEAGQVASALPQIAGQRGEVRRGLKEGWRGKWGEAESQAEAEVGMSGTRNSWGPCVQTSSQSGPTSHPSPGLEPDTPRREEAPWVGLPYPGWR